MSKAISVRTYKLGNGGTENLIHLPKVAQLVSDETEFKPRQWCFWGCTCGPCMTLTPFTLLPLFTLNLWDLVCGGARTQTQV